MTALRIFSGDADEHGWRRLLNLPPNGYLRVREYYQRFMVPLAKRRKLKRTTLQAFETAIGRWEQYAKSELKRWQADEFGRMVWTPLSPGSSQYVDDPPIGIVVDDDLTALQDTMQEAGFPDSTINTTRRNLLPIFNLAGPRTERGGGRGDLLVRPFCPLLEDPVKQNFIPTEDEIDAFFRAANHARFPRDPKVSATQWWQSLIVFLCNYGLGCAEWKTLEWDEHLLEDCTLLRYARQKNIRKRPDPVMFEINATTRWYLQQIRSTRKSRQKNRRVFFSAKSRNSFEPEWNRLVQIAGVSRTEVRKDGKTYELFNRHAIRRFCNQYMNDHAPGNIGEYLLNHAFSDRNAVNHRSYSRIYVPPKHVTESLHAVEQMPIFLEAMDTAA